MSAEVFNPSNDDALAELSKLSPLEYDQVRENKAKELSCRVSTLDQEVAKARGDVAEDSAGDVVEELTPWPESVDGVALMDSIAGSFQRHVVLPDGARTVVTLWSIGSFCMDAWRIWPKLLITSPEKRCGKSTLLEALEGVCYRPLLTSSITASSLFRCIEEWTPTLLIDEADTFAKDNDELNGIINAGHTKRTATVIRSEKDGDGFKPKKFSVWCPQVIAGIKNQRDTLHDRSIHIQMRRKLPGESAQKMPFDYFEQQQAIRRQCLRWAADNITRLKTASPTVPNYGNDRAEDNWNPLFAIAEMVGGQWPDSVLKAYQVMNVGIDDDDTIGPMILSDMREIFGGTSCGVIHSDDLVASLIGLEERPWCEWRHGKPLTKISLARLLKPFSIKSRQIKIGKINRNGYQKKDFQDAFNRYLSPVTPIQNSTTLQASHSKGFSDIQNPTKGGQVELQKRLKASHSKDCREVEFKKGDNGSKGGNGYSLELIDAATTACSGLNISAGDFISQLDTDDHQEIIKNPTVARATAQSMAARK